MRLGSWSHLRVELVILDGSHQNDVRIYVAGAGHIAVNFPCVHLTCIVESTLERLIRRDWPGPHKYRTIRRNRSLAEQLLRGDRDSHTDGVDLFHQRMNHLSCERQLPGL